MEPSTYPIDDIDVNAPFVDLGRGLSHGLSTMESQKILSVQERGVSICQNPGEVIEFGGQRFTADDTKGFCQFELAHSIPVVTAFGTCLAPNVIAKSYQSMLFQGLNFEHRLKTYDPDKKIDDRILGTIVAVDYPKSPSGGFKVQSDRAKAPGIQAVAAFSKLAHGMDTIIGKHKSGRKRYAVSMECSWVYQDSGFLVSLNGKAPENQTPQDIVDLGYEYIPWSTASDSLLGTFSLKKKRIVGKYKGRDTMLVMGGLDSEVHFNGVGVVEFGAEREAQIVSMVASYTDEVYGGLMSPLEKLVSLIQ